MVSDVFGGPTVEEFARIVRDGDAPYPERIEALDAAARSGTEGVLDLILEALRANEKHVRRRAADLLADYEEPNVIAALSDAAAFDSDEGVRRNAVRTLGRFSGKAVLDALYRAIKDENPIVSDAARAALDSVRKRRQQAAKDLLSSEAERIRGAAGAPEAGPSAEEAQRQPPDAAAPPRTAWEPMPRPASEPKPQPSRPRKPEPAPPERRFEPVEPASAVVTEAKGYVPPTLARFPALRGLSASEELGWPDLLRCLRMARRVSHVAICAAALGIVGAGWLAAASLLGVDIAAPGSWTTNRWFLPAALLATWVVMSLTGIVVSRMTCLALADRPAGLRRALGFLGRRFASFILPVVVSSAFWIAPVGLIVLAGRLSTLPSAGAAVRVVSYPLCLLAATWAVLTFIGAIAGLPMMTAVICVENTGCSDAVTSSWACLFSRPWRYAFYWMVSAVTCAVNLAIFAAVIYVAQAAFAFGAGVPGALDPAGCFMPGTDPAGIAHGVILWLMASYVVSCYFTARTGIYMLMRKAVDGVDLSEIG